MEACHWSDLPQVYGDNMIVLMIQEPQCLWSHWEVDADMMRSLYGNPEDPVPFISLVLRLYQSDAPCGTGMVETLDLNVDRLQGSLYINPSRPSIYYWIDLGMILGDCFVALLRSAIISRFDGSVSLKDLPFPLLPSAPRIAEAGKGEEGWDLPSSTEHFRRS
ncbi:MAG: DUF4912 domain-containing protein [Bacillota bacterium]